MFMFPDWGLQGRLIFDKIDNVNELTSANVQVPASYYVQKCVKYIFPELGRWRTLTVPDWRLEGLGHRLCW